MDIRDIVEQLEKASQATLNTISAVPKDPGLYALYYTDAEKRTNICLKVGKAGPQRKNGLYGRLMNHFRSNVSDSVLARHLRADAGSTKWRTLGFNMANKSDRQRFLASLCYFKTVILLRHDEPDLLRLESRLEAILSPRYKGTVGGPYSELT